MIVVDASALIAFILREEGWEDLAKYMVMSVSIDHVVKEAVNVIWKTVHLRKLINVKDAYEAFKLLKQLIGKNIILQSEIEYIDKAFEIAINYGVE